MHVVLIWPKSDHGIDVPMFSPDLMCGLKHNSSGLGHTSSAPRPRSEEELVPSPLVKADSSTSLELCPACYASGGVNTASATPEVRELDEPRQT